MYKLCATAMFFGNYIIIWMIDALESYRRLSTNGKTILTHNSLLLIVVLNAEREHTKFLPELVNSNWNPDDLV